MCRGLIACSSCNAGLRIYPHTSRHPLHLLGPHFQRGQEALRLATVEVNGHQQDPEAVMGLTASGRGHSLLDPPEESRGSSR